MSPKIDFKTLYICYFGLREPLVQTQVIPYLREIQNGGVLVSLLTFEPDLGNSWTSDQIEAERGRLKQIGIKWHRLAYHKRPSAPATLYDTLAGARYIRKLHASERFDVFHARVHVPALMAVTARRLSRHKPKIIFDIRGFFPEEYTDAGIWPEDGWLYRSVKRVEKRLLRESDGFVVLTEKAREILFPAASGSTVEGSTEAAGRPVEVIPCCVDLERFAGVDADVRDVLRGKLGAEGRFVLAYVGSFGGWYLSDEMFEMFAALREAEPTLYILILTQRQTEAAVSRLTASGFDANDFHVASVPPAEIPKYLAAADAGVSFVKPSFSKQASSPTKNAEYLAAGLPIIANSGVGDVDEQLVADGVGVLVDQFDKDSYLNAFKQLRALGDVREKCRLSAKKRFDLETVGGVRYRRLYERLSD